MTLDADHFQDLKQPVQFDQPLARYTSWRLGGPADVFYRPADSDDLAAFLAQLPASMPVTFVGLGSNVLIRDGGIRGAVVLTLATLGSITLQDHHQVRAECGVTCAKLSKFCMKHGFEDGAFFAGIPGTVGGALRMNAGAFGGETWPHVVSVEMITPRGARITHQADDFQVDYRCVDGLAGNFFLSAIFQFTPGDGKAVQEKIKALLRTRQEKQPIGALSCGSVFRNPPDDFAARLIESVGLKGRRLGGACVSEKHANFIVNDADASAQDVESLIDLVQETVLRETGVALVRECIVLGESA